MPRSATWIVTWLFPERMREFAGVFWAAFALTSSSNVSETHNNRAAAAAPQNAAPAAAKKPSPSPAKKRQKTGAAALPRCLGEGTPTTAIETGLRAPACCAVHKQHRI